MIRLVALILLFAAAPARAEWSAPIPFELDNNLILVAVSVDGGPPGTFILDTGAYSMLDARAADRLGLARRRVGGTDGTGATSQPVYAPETPYRLSLAGHEIAPRRSLIVPLAAAEACFNAPLPATRGLEHRNRTLDGILGREFFEHYVVEIDYPRRILRVRNPGGWAPPAGSAPIPVELAPQHFYVRATVTAPDGRVLPGRLLVDTGYVMGLGLNRPFVEANGLRPAPGTFEVSEACGLNGEAAERSEMADIGGLRVGDAASGSLLTEYSRSQQASDFDGYLGGGFLKAYRVTIALAHRQILLEAPPR